MFEEVFVEKTICGAYITEEASRLDNEEAGEFFSEVHRLMNLKTDFKFFNLWALNFNADVQNFVQVTNSSFKYMRV